MKRLLIIVTLCVVLVSIAIYGTRYQVLYSSGDAVFLLNRWTGTTTIATPGKGLANQAQMREARERLQALQR